ncbi:glycerate kinase [Saccharicrinis fermentans]|uniref:Glycerate kinase n=1 Tax=Saccharicrinis fermentans DSM 9555 = JCM 21142 TaxID=869213 RepID=W7Y582_9BACT|nr:glycerate kinase [Saccharicrinis fermentans]GAF02708.1 glycerate kinase [Saccharicrinis fermentans DSM 9555 = JCM 21142]
MKIVIAPDKFKGSLTGLEFCATVERSLKAHSVDAKIINLPLADGGDGTIEVLNYYLEGRMISLEVHDPLHRVIKASYLYSEIKKTAYIEMAEASGIRLLRDYELNPLQTSSYGTGELIKDALHKGVKHIILGIGGSATNDAGIGMAKALGYHFYNNSHQELEGNGNNLLSVFTIDSSDADWIITGEGKLDNQTLSGKVIKGIMESITTQKLAIFCGISELNTNHHHTLKIDYLKETCAYAKNQEDSIRKANLYLSKVAQDFASKHL